MILIIDFLYTWLVASCAWHWLEPNRTHQWAMMLMIFVLVMFNYAQGLAKR